MIVAELNLETIVSEREEGTVLPLVDNVETLGRGATRR